MKLKQTEIQKMYNEGETLTVKPLEQKYYIGNKKIKKSQFQELYDSNIHKKIFQSETKKSYKKAILC